MCTPVTSATPAVATPPASTVAGASGGGAAPGKVDAPPAGKMPGMPADCPMNSMPSATTSPTQGAVAGANGGGPSDALGGAAQLPGMAEVITALQGVITQLANLL